MIIVSPSDDLRGLIDRSARTNCHLSGLLPAIAAGLHVVIVNQRQAPVSMAKLRAITGPVLVLLGDDDYSSTGPAGWISAPNLVRWADVIVVHAAGGERAHYAEAARAALSRGRVLLVETDTKHASHWIAATGPKTRLVILPHDGPHPIVPARSAMH